jgi:hypothetical protein
MAGHDDDSQGRHVTRAEGQPSRRSEGVQGAEDCRILRFCSSSANVGVGIQGYA